MAKNLIMIMKTSQKNIRTHCRTLLQLEVFVIDEAPEYTVGLSDTADLADHWISTLQDFQGAYQLRNGGYL